MSFTYYVIKNEFVNSPQDRDEVRTRQGQDRDEIGTRQGQDKGGRG